LQDLRSLFTQVTTAAGSRGAAAASGVACHQLAVSLQQCAAQSPPAGAGQPTAVDRAGRFSDHIGHTNQHGHVSGPGSSCWATLRLCRACLSKSTREQAPCMSAAAMVRRCTSTVPGCVAVLPVSCVWFASGMGVGVGCAARVDSLQPCPV
jgi:hypothetical protein